MDAIHRWFCVACFCLLLGLAGCHGTAYVDPVAFDQKITNSNTKETDAATKLGTLLSQAIQNTPGSVTKLRPEHTSFVQSLNQAKAEMAILQIPDDPTSKAYYEAYRQYLQARESMATHELDQAIICMENKKLSFSAKATIIAPLVESLFQKEENYHKAFVDARSAFASAHHLTFTP